MSNEIESFGGEGAHEVQFRTADGLDTTWVKRDLWFDRTDGQSWLVWAQVRSWAGDALPTDQDAELLGSIVVTHPAVMAFIDQLGELLVNPTRFRHDPRFGEESGPSHSAEPDARSTE
jgi:hypothetical protein